MPLLDKGQAQSSERDKTRPSFLDLTYILLHELVVYRELLSVNTDVYENLKLATVTV